jgi:glycosyltransferase involved in cell wall biosynthesis
MPLENKKILQVCTAYYPAISVGGPILSIYYMNEALCNGNFSISVLSTDHGLSKNEKLNLVYDKFLFDKFHYPILFFKYYFYDNFTFSPRYFLWLIKNVKKYDFVILHGVWNFPFLAAYISCKINSVKFFVVPHGNIYKETVELKSHKLKKIFIILYVKNMLKRANAVLFTTHDEKEKVEKYLNTKLNCEIIPNAVDINLFNSTNINFRSKYKISESTFLMIHYGRISKKKGIEYVIKVLPKLLKVRKDILYVIVGGDDEDYNKEIVKIAKEKNVFSNILFTGLVTQSEGQSALRASDLFILTSLSENFGMSIVESMLCGTPTIISNNVGISDEVVKNNAGIVVDLLNDEQLYESIFKIISDSNFRNKLIHSGKLFAQNNYSIDVISNKLSNLFSKF